MSEIGKLKFSEGTPDFPLLQERNPEHTNWIVAYKLDSCAECSIQVVQVRCTMTHVCLEAASSAYLGEQVFPAISRTGSSPVCLDKFQER